MQIKPMILAILSMAATQALATPDPNPMRSAHWFCGVPGAGCKRLPAGPNAGSLEVHQTPESVEFCSVPGEVCTMLQQTALAVRDALADHWAEYDIPKTGASALCNAPGGRCNVARAAIGNVSETAETAYHELMARKSKHHKVLYVGGANIWFCGVPGAACKKRRYEAAAMERRNDDRIATSTATAAEGAVKNDVDPESSRRECAKNGNECHSLLRAHAAFHQAKRDAEAVRALTDPTAKRAYCAVYDCDADDENYFRHLQSDSPEAQRIRRECFAKDGECTRAQRSLDALERSLNDAIAQIA